MNSEQSCPLSSLAALRKLQMGAHYCFSTERFEALTGRGTSVSASRAALHRLHAQGLIKPLARGAGLWLIVPPEHLDRGAPPVMWWLHDYLIQKEDDYQLALLSAAQAHGSSHFAVLETQVFVPVPRRVLHVGRFRLRLFCKQSVAQAPTVMLSTEKTRVRVSSVATTLIDLLRHALAIGGIERAALILQDLAPKLAPQDISQSLAAAGDIAGAQRFGYLLDLYGHSKPASRVEEWLSPHRTQRTRLDTSSPAADCPVSQRWNVVPNTNLESID
ncbi:type IV toxin-antitoxin system AbiEi family antitoxin domain-containing protein [Burkholderia sp. PAMC 26561]|uniref:type IV toxin-antitoxin system AbiEi family antitoxin domain-containing protein n=1 Tax=Burkholderia sp. PAMC 26561 TaxID=1795043 RepID=UPI0009EB8B23|nr:type IV toxin-antitoxin system AbiEi family antitoxin [Burkholderia sp. PAMC 26561]